MPPPVFNLGSVVRALTGRAQPAPAAVAVSPVHGGRVLLEESGAEAMVQVPLQREPLVRHGHLFAAPTTAEGVAALVRPAPVTLEGVLALILRAPRTIAEALALIPAAPRTEAELLQVVRPAPRSALEVRRAAMAGLGIEPMPGGQAQADEAASQRRVTAQASRGLLFAALAAGAVYWWARSR